MPRAALIEQRNEKGKAVEKPAKNELGVLAAVVEGKEYSIGWVYERPNSNNGRSFGFVGGHFHDNFGIKPFRQAVVNGILWTAHIDVPEKGAPISILPKDMELPPEEPKKK